MYTGKQQSSSITLDQAQKRNFSQTKEVKLSHPPAPPLFYKVNSQSLQPLLWRDYGDKSTFPKHNSPRQIVLGCSQFTPCIPLSKEKTKIIFCVSKKICVRQFYFTSKSWRQIWWCVKQSFKYILFINVFIHKV